MTTTPSDHGRSGSGSAPKKSGIRRWLTPALALVAAIAIGLTGGVLIGRNTASASQAGAARAGFGGAGGFPGAAGASGAPGAGGAGGGGGFTAGTIVSVSNGQLVIKAADGTQKTVTTDSSTKVSKTSASDVSALKAGQTVTVIGATGSDGTVTATSISEGAGAGRGGFGGGGGGGAAPTPSN
ncbi:MAG: hypothetical protein JWO01_197 [Microbacteriaceae bacterium]|nr:hypothetical protein [Microbacteriaceae bacterium]